MPAGLLADLERTAERACDAVREALAEAERSPLARAVEAYARARALLLAHILVEQLKQQLSATPPATIGEVIVLLDATLVAAAATYVETVGHDGPRPRQLPHALPGTPSDEIGRCTA